MRKLVILLALFAISFVAVLVYGGRNRGGADGGGAPRMDGDKPDKDAMEDWHPPDVMKGFDGFAGKFAKGIALEQPVVSLPDGGGYESRAVPQATKEGPRFAKLLLTSGNSAKITSNAADTLCLCAVGSQLRPEEMVLFQNAPACNPRWIIKQAGVCQKGADEGKLTFDKDAGSLIYRAAFAAVVTAK